MTGPPRKRAGAGVKTYVQGHRSRWTANFWVYGAWCDCGWTSSTRVGAGMHWWMVGKAEQHHKTHYINRQASDADQPRTPLRP